MSVPEVTAPNSSPLAPPSDDQQIVARIRAGDEQSFGALYLAHHDALWRFAYGYVRSRDVAEELVQEVFLGVWSARAEWDVRTRVRAWLYAAVRHQALNYLRHERVSARLLGARAADPSSDTVAMGAPPPDAHEAVEAGELDDTLTRAMEELPERRRAAMTLRWKHDLSAIEIARVLGTTPEAVRVLLTRARQELAAFVARSGPRPS